MHHVQEAARNDAQPRGDDGAGGSAGASGIGYQAIIVDKRGAIETAARNAPGAGYFLGLVVEDAVGLPSGTRSNDWQY